MVENQDVTTFENKSLTYKAETKTATNYYIETRKHKFCILRHFHESFHPFVKLYSKFQGIWDVSKLFYRFKQLDLRP